MQATAHTLDARGLKCPMPIIRTSKTMAAIGSGEVLEVTTDDKGSVGDMESFCNQNGHVLLSSETRTDGFSFRIRKS